MGGGFRLGDLLGGLSIACDLGFGLPPEEAMRSCLIATALARRMGLPESEVSDTYYTALLTHVGCSALSHETVVAWGHDQRVLRVAAQTNVADPDDIAGTLLPAVTARLSPADRARVERYAASPEGQEFGHRFDTGSCEVASATARRVGLGSGVARALKEAVEWWNGQGPPDGLQGEEIALPGRIARASADAARFDALGGTEAVVAALKARSGVILDPAIVATFTGDADELLAEAHTGDPRERLLEVEPEPVREIPRTELRRVAVAFGDLADLKTPWTHGHSDGVTKLVRTAAKTLRLDEQSASRLELSALLGDLGRIAVSNVIWEKPGPFTAAEWEQARMHAYHTERILATSDALAPLARVAGMHHERLDGSGYYRGCNARELPPAVRILAAADAFHAMTQDRPHRPAFGAEQAADELRREVRAGRLDGDAAAAVLEAAGATRPRRRDDNLRPGGLSEREIEVARLVAAGCSNPEIAARLVISRRTAEHHVQHIYAKVGVSSRAGLALFVHEHGLIAETPAG
jgi:HD-GYP domain-containing protein (c-di-GMP phosphodiesterase class II)/DNA-binding CsgD family transcriptional regulator